MTLSGQQLAQDFQQTMLKKQINGVECTDTLRKICCQLIDLNYGMKRTFTEMLKQDWQSWEQD